MCTERPRGRRRRSAPRSETAAPRARTGASSSATTTSSPATSARGLDLLGVRQQELRRAVFDPQPDAVGTEQGEEGHRDRAALDGAEQGGVEGQRRLQHDRHAIAGGDAARGEPVGEARGPLGQITKTERLVAPVGMGDADGDPPRVGVPVQALDRDVQRAAVAVEERPQRRRREVPVGVGVGRVVRQSRHGSRAPLYKDIA